MCLVVAVIMANAYHEIFRKRVNISLVGDHQSEISVVLHALEYQNPYMLALIFVNSSTSAKIDVTKEELALELRMWLNGKIIDYPSKVASSRIQESMMNFLKFGRTPAQTDIFLWMLSRIETVMNGNNLLLFFGGTKDPVSQNGEYSSTELKRFISTNRTDQTFQSSTFHTATRSPPTIETIERPKSAPTQRIRTSNNFGTTYDKYTPPTQQFTTAEHVVGKSQALEELSKTSVKGRKDAKKTLVTLELTNDHYRLMNHIQQRRNVIEKSLEDRRKIIVTGTVRNDQTLQKYRQIRESTSSSQKINSWVKQANDEIMTLDRIQTALDEDIKRQIIQNQRNGEHIRWTMAPNGYEIYRGKYQKGYVIGSGPLPADATTSLRDPRLESTLKHYTWDEHGRRHQKKNVGDDLGVMEEAMEIIRKASTNASLYKLNLKDLFHEMDSSGDGYLTITELHTFFLSLGLQLNPQSLQALYSHFDANHSGSIHYSEFIWAFFNRRSFLKQWKQNTKSLSRSQIQNLFNKHDINGNGTLNQKEFEKLLKKFKINLSRNDIEILMSRFDHDGDGELDLVEFYEYIQNEMNSSPQTDNTVTNRKDEEDIRPVVKSSRKSENGSQNDSPNSLSQPLSKSSLPPPAYTASEGSDMNEDNLLVEEGHFPIPQHGLNRTMQSIQELLSRQSKLENRLGRKYFKTIK